MNRAAGKVKKSKAATVSRFEAYAYKPKKACMPFGLTAAESPMISEILDNDDSLMSSVKGLMAQAKSDGTMENYERMTTKFATFCGEKGYSYPRFTEKAALHFVIQLDKDKSSWSVLCQVKPALALV